MRSDKIGYKIREHSLQKIPYLVVVGEKEKQAGQVAVRVPGRPGSGRHGAGGLMEKIGADVSSKGLSTGS